MNKEDSKVNIRGVMFDRVNMSEALNKALNYIGSDGLDYIVTPNSEIVQNCIENPENYKIIKEGIKSRIDTMKEQNGKLFTKKGKNL